MNNRVLSRLLRISLLGSIVFALSLGAESVSAQLISVTSVPEGYEAGAIALPEAFAGALAAHPSNPNVIYAAVGSYGASHVCRIDFSNPGAPAVTTILSIDVDYIGGMAILDDHTFLITNNADVGGPLPGETILIARDFNPADGDYDDPNEVTELIAPILEDDPVGMKFTVSKIRVVPSSGPGGLEPGRVLVQTSDTTETELLVIDQPASPSTAAYVPAGGAWFSYAGYDGGLDFTSTGYAIMGTLDYMFSGAVYALRDSGGTPNQIDTPAEAHAFLTGLWGCSDLTLDGADRGYVAVYGDVMAFDIPADPLTQSTTASTFVSTNSGFLTGILIQSKSLNFAPNSGPGGARLFFSGWNSTFSAVDSYLYYVTPTPLSEVANWTLY